MALACDRRPRPAELGRKPAADLRRPWENPTVPVSGGPREGLVGFRDLRPPCAAPPVYRIRQHQEQEGRLYRRTDPPLLVTTWAEATRDHHRM